MILPRVRFFGHILRLLYLILELFIPFLRAVRLLIAAILLKIGSEKMQSWGGSQWWAFNIDTAAFGYGTKYRTVSGIAAERAELYPRYKMLRDFIDMCSEKNHCMKEYTFEKMYSMDAYGAKK